MRWKILEFLGKLNSSDKITYGFKSRNCPPIVHELENLNEWNELLFMIKNIQFRKVNNSFQNQLNEDIKQIKRDSKIFVPADKLATFIKWTGKLMKSYYMKTSQGLVRKRIGRK